MAALRFQRHTNEREWKQKTVHKTPHFTKQLHKRKHKKAYIIKQNRKHRNTRALFQNHEYWVKTGHSHIEFIWFVWTFCSEHCVVVRRS